MQIRSTILVLILAIPMGMAAQTPLREFDLLSPMRPLPVCQDSLPIVGDTTGLGLIGPEAISFGVPPFPVPKRLRGTTMELRILVNVVGGMDSIVMSDTSHQEYLNKWREVIVAHHRFEPAHMNGCRRSAWTMFTVRFDR